MSAPYWKLDLPIWMVDAETTFHDTNTLTKHTLEEYVRSPYFEVLGFAVARVDGGSKDPALWVPHDELKDFFQELVADGAAFAAHHAQFDGFILSEHYGVKPDFWYDTISMSRATSPRKFRHSLSELVKDYHLGEEKSVPYKEMKNKTLEQVLAAPGLYDKVAEGGRHDAELQRTLFNILRPAIPDDELLLIDKTIRLFTEPCIHGDLPTLQRCFEEAAEDRRGLPERIGVALELLNSSDKFACLLRGAGVEPPTKPSPTNGKAIYAFAQSDLAFQALEGHDDPYVRDLVAARLAAKSSIHETRPARLLSTAQRGPIPVYLKYYAAHTGRFGGGDKQNLQNLPSEGDIESALRPPRGYSFVRADLSQIECRLTATIAGANNLVSAFREGRDVYSEFGTKAYRKPVSKKENPELRFRSKQVVLGCGFGLGYDKLHLKFAKEGTPIPRDESDLLLDTYRKRWAPEVPELWAIYDQMLNLMSMGREGDLGYVRYDGTDIWLPNGLRLDYTGLHWDANHGRRGSWRSVGGHIWGGMMTENIVQALARIHATVSWLTIADSFDINIFMSTHDDLAAIVLDKDVEQVCEIMEAVLTVPPHGCQKFR